MARKLKVAAAQMGAVHLDAVRSDTMQRMIKLLQSAASQGAQLVVFPETAFTTFFPRHLFAEQTKLDEFFEHGEDVSESKNVKLLFDEARTLEVDISVGFGERTADGTGYNTAVYYSAKLGKIIGKYRKVHLPGTSEPFENVKAINQLEKRYFKPGDLGYPAFRAPGLLPNALKKRGSAGTESTVGKGDPILGMLICNDRRWPEAWRCYGLQGVDIVLCGYNTTGWAPDLWGTTKPTTPEKAEEEALFHHRLSMQANSYMNSCFSISAARAGKEDGKYDLIAGSSIVDPQGHIIVEATTKEDEVIVAEIDLQECMQNRGAVFDFARHRRIETYGLIGKQTSASEPELLEE